MDWTKLPDLAAVAALTCAFASVARRGQTSASRHWLTGWVLIALHFAALIFLNAPGVWGVLAGDIALISLTPQAFYSCGHRFPIAWRDRASGC